MSKRNPFLIPYETPDGVPPFDEISLAHYSPAVSAGIKQQKDEISSILKLEENPTFANTILALEQSGEILRRTTAVMYNLSFCHASDALQSLIQKLAPKLSAHSDTIYMNAKLFKRVNYLMTHAVALSIKGIDFRLLETYYKTFVSNGAQLKSKVKKEVSQINQRLSVLSLQFGQNLLKATNDYTLIIKNPTELSGLPQNIINEAQQTAIAKGINGAWVFTLQNASVISYLTYGDDRKKRKEIWSAMIHKCDHTNDGGNRLIAKEILELRYKKAVAMGFKNHAEYILKDRMAKNPEKVIDLLMNLWERAKDATTKEASALQQAMNADGIKGDLQAYDWRYYAEKVRKAYYDLDEEMLKPYFSLDNVVEGMFDVAHRLYGLSLIKSTTYPIYQVDVVCYDVLDHEKKRIGILYMDYFPRDNKIGGAWMTSYREQTYDGDQRVLPLISIVCNFTKPIGKIPSLLTYDEVNTLFHEFGHALHGLLSDVSYASLAGTNVPTDFVELPSQIMENWATEREVLIKYARHYITGEGIPTTLLDKLERSHKFGQGFAITEYLAAAILDMRYHMTEPDKIYDFDQFETSLWTELELLPSIISRYRTAYFSHIFAGGYSVGYYSYIWSEVLDADAYSLFKEKGIFDKATAEGFKENILKKGGSEESDILYQKFRGREPNIDALLEKRGLLNR